LSDAVFRAETAAEPRDEIVDDSVGARRVAEESGCGRSGGRRQIVVQVAVAQVPEHDVAHARQSGVELELRVGEKRRNPRHGQAEIVVDVWSLETLRFWN